MRHQAPNLILTPQGQVRIMDFGFAQVGDRTRITKPMTGSSIPPSRRTDVASPWSLSTMNPSMCGL